MTPHSLPRRNIWKDMELIAEQLRRIQKVDGRRMREIAQAAGYRSPAAFYRLVDMEEELKPNLPTLLRFLKATGYEIHFRKIGG